jgi:ABC-type uncharacterized transport system permease subunit
MIRSFATLGASFGGGILAASFIGCLGICSLGCVTGFMREMNLEYLYEDFNIP